MNIFFTADTHFFHYNIIKYCQINKKLVVLSHYPIIQWNCAQRGSYHLYGHTHGSIKLAGKAFDVGIDNHPEFKLWSWEELRAILKQRKVINYPQKPYYPQRKINNLGLIEQIEN